MKSSSWTLTDLKQMKALAIDPKEASRQLELFEIRPPSSSWNGQPGWAMVSGAWTLRLKQSALLSYRKAALRGKFTKFVPASGAASRMFHLLMRFLQREPFSAESLRAEVLRGEKESRQFLDFVESLSRIAFFDELGQALSKKQLDLETLRREGRFQDILKALLLPEGLNYSQKPKGLIQFHSYSSERRTPLEEHLVEGIRYLKGPSKRCRIHFTVSEEHEDECRDHFMSVRKKYEKKYGVKFDIDFSIQESSSNTLAVDLENRPFRDAEGAAGLPALGSRGPFGEFKPPQGGLGLHQKYRQCDFGTTFGDHRRMEENVGGTSVRDPRAPFQAIGRTPQKEN